jgi:hypothetical protein
MFAGTHERDQRAEPSGANERTIMPVRSCSHRNPVTYTFPSGSVATSVSSRPTVLSQITGGSD